MGHLALQERPTPVQALGRSGPAWTAPVPYYNGKEQYGGGNHHLRWYHHQCRSSSHALVVEKKYLIGALGLENGKTLRRLQTA